MTRTMLSVNIDRETQSSCTIRWRPRSAAPSPRGGGPGERLPLVKDIAAVLGVNKNTVLRAMHILRDEGLLEFTRGRGITVSGSMRTRRCS